MVDSSLTPTRNYSIVFPQKRRGLINDGQPATAYGTTFSQSQARFINWQLNLTHPDPGRKIKFDIQAKYYDSKGKAVIAHTTNTHIKSGWTSSTHANGYGDDKRGTWKPGAYQVELMINEEMVAAGNFSIVQGQAAVPPKKLPAQKIRPGIPDDLGEL